MADPAQNDAEKAPETSAVLLQAKGLTIHTRAGLSLLSDISFHIEPGELVALTGLSGTGKSTLLQSLAGLMQPSGGEILIDGINLYSNLKSFSSIIGFVPAEFALQQNLTVTETLQDAAKLRLPRTASSHDRKQRVLTLLDTVSLKHAMDRRVGLLSEAEKRRLSIAVELVGYPKLLLVDESAEILSPFEEVQITILMRELSRQGITIVHVNASSRSAGVSDKIIFLAPGGLLSWFGPSDEAFTFLKSFIPRGVVKDLFGLQEGLAILVNPQPRDGIEWAKRFKEHAAYEKYVDDPLNNRYPDLLLQTRPLLRIRLRNSSKEKLPPTIRPRASTVQKLILLIRRNFRLLWRDKTALLMLAIPPLVALVHFIVSSNIGLNPIAGETNSPSTGLLVLLVIWTSALLVQNEIFKERTVYQRENRTSSLLFPYVLSKVLLVAVLAIYQGLVWMIILSFGESVTGLGRVFQTLPTYGFTLFLVAFVGGILGLLLSALSRTTMTIAGWVILLIVPQLFLIFDPLSQWSKLAVVSLFLIALLVTIQRGAGAKT